MKELIERARSARIMRVCDKNLIDDLADALEQSEEKIKLLEAQVGRDEESGVGEGIGMVAGAAAGLALRRALSGCLKINDELPGDSPSLAGVQECIGMIRTMIEKKGTANE